MPAKHFAHTHIHTHTHIYIYIHIYIYLYINSHIRTFVYIRFSTECTKALHNRVTGFVKAEMGKCKHVPYTQYHSHASWWTLYGRRIINEINEV